MYKYKILYFLLIHYQIWLLGIKMHAVRYLFESSLIFIRILIISICKDLFHCSLLCKILFDFGFIINLFSSLYLHCLEKKQTHLVEDSKSFFFSNSCPSENISLPLLDLSIDIHLHINLNEVYNFILNILFLFYK
jgi:hypothetical protein